jgi:hypothetical protein
MRQIDILEARRRTLLARCDQQRIDLSYRIERLAPGKHFSSWMSTLGRLTRSGMSSPLAFWGITLGFTLLFLRPRRVLGRLAWLSTALALVSRVSQITRIIGQWRDVRAGLARLRA